MEQYGNTSTFNLESVLVQNIKISPYFIRKAVDLESVYEVIDEIYDTVDHVEPWLSGNARGPSSAFCLIFRLAQLKPSPPEIREMLDHKDSPYIRAIGFLYLRYCCDPRDLLRWFKKYFKDQEEFAPSPGASARSITIGDFVRDILLDQYYFETIFPRIPKLVADDVCDELRALHLPTTAVGNAGQGGAARRGGDGGGSKRPASVKASLSVAFGQRAPNRAGVREEGRGMRSDEQLMSSRGGGGGRVGSKRRSRSRSRSRERDVSHWRQRDSSSGRPRHRSRSRSRDGGDQGRYSRSRREYGGGGGDGGGGRYRSRSRSRERSRRNNDRNGGGGSGGRDVSDVFRERPVLPQNPSSSSSHY